MAISTVVLTKNEEKNIADCLKTLQWCDEILIIDDYSIDKTVSIAKKSGAKIYKHGLSKDFSQQRNFGLSKAQSEWVLFVDCDERISEDLASEIVLRIDKQEVIESGFYVKRLDFLWNKQLKFGETGNISLLRLAKKNAGKWEGKVHEEWRITGKVGRLQYPLIHHPHQSIAEFLQEINFYTELRAQELFLQKVHVSLWQIVAYPKAKFLVNYFLKLGFLDGVPGLILAICMSLHSFLVRGKLWQLWKKK